MNEKLVKLLEEAEKTIGLLMLEVNRLNDELEKQSLSNEEIRNLWGSIKDDLGYLKFAHLIEEAHGIKKAKEE